MGTSWTKNVVEDYIRVGYYVYITIDIHHEDGKVDPKKKLAGQKRHKTASMEGT